MFILSNRLQMIANQVNKCNLLVDVGTDHAYIPIYLLKNGIVTKAIAADISKGSCDKARKNIHKYFCEEYIETRCGDGLKVINHSDRPNCVVIAGMGGKLAIEVLKGNPEVVNGLDRLIVQPQKDIDKVRQYLHRIGFKIINEEMLFEDGQYYTIIVSQKGEDLEYSAVEYQFGKILIDKKNEALRAYLEFEVKRLKKIVNSFSDKSSNKIDKREIELSNKIKSFEEVLKCL